MQNHLSIEDISLLLTACHQAKHVTELQPALPNGITPGHLKVLDCVHHYEANGHSAKVSDIADEMQVTRPGITRLVRELEGFSALEKITDTQDKRIVRLRLTSKGHELYTYYILRYHNWLAEQIESISAEDIRTTAATIAKLYQTLSSHTPMLQGQAPVISKKGAAK